VILDIVNPEDARPQHVEGYAIPGCGSHNSRNVDSLRCWRGNHPTMKTAQDKICETCRYWSELVMRSEAVEAGFLDDHDIKRPPDELLGSSAQACQQGK
jgi:hypothetical protein